MSPLQTTMESLLSFSISFSFNSAVSLLRRASLMF
jgi:hypothetical protein